MCVCGRLPLDPATDTPQKNQRQTPPGSTGLPPEPEADPAIETATGVGGTHPTGMYSCYSQLLNQLKHCTSTGYLGNEWFHHFVLNTRSNAEIVEHA